MLSRLRRQIEIEGRGKITTWNIPSRLGAFSAVCLSLGKLSDGFDTAYLSLKPRLQVARMGALLLYDGVSLQERGGQKFMIVVEICWVCLSPKIRMLLLRLGHAKVR
jgi:hypothetical protein